MRGRIKKAIGLNVLPLQAFDISIDQEITVPRWKWIDIVEDTTSGDGRFLSKGEICGIQRGGRLLVLGFSPNSKFTLVENLTPRRGK